MKRIAFTVWLTVVSMMAMATHLPDVEGTVVDEQGQPLEFVNVVLLSEGDSAFVQGATTDATGHFLIKTPENHGVLKVTSVGYKTTFANTHTFGGRVVLKDDAKMLQEVTVKGSLPKTKLMGNSMVTAIQGTVLEKSGSAKEMLSKVPGMTLKGDALEVLGKGTPIYYINGRKMQNADELTRLRSEEIKEVEVITNPGAQYDATVTAVVRIKTIRRQGNGFGFDLTANSQNDLRYGYWDGSSTLNMRYRYKAFELFGMMNGWKHDQMNDSAPHQWSYYRSGDQLTGIDQNTRLLNHWTGKGLDWNVGFNLQLAENHTVGMRIEQHKNYDSGYDAWQKTYMTKMIVGKPDSKEETNNVTEEQLHEHYPYNWEGNAFYNGKVGKLNIDLNIDFLTNKKEENGDIQESVNLENNTMTSDSKTTNQMFADKLVLGYPVWKGMLQVGSEMSRVTRRSFYQITMDGVPTTDSKVKENSIAAFVEYACQIPKVGSVSAGLRYEHVGFDYKDRINNDNSLERYTNDLFPSFSWANQWGAVQTSLSYSMKTQRPNYWMLNEAVIYINPYSLQTGDPKLKNAKTHSIGANARWKWLNLMANYERTDDALTQWSYIYNDKGVILVKNRNLDVPVRSVSVFLTASPTWGCYSPSWTVGMRKFDMKQTLADPREASGVRTVHYNRPFFVANLNNVFRLPHKWQLESYLYFQRKGDYMNFRLTNNVCNLGFVVQKCWLKNDALCLRVTVDDVLQRTRQKVNMDCGYYTLNQNSAQSNHRLNISLRYSFNASGSKYKGTGAGKEAAGRMAQ